MKIGDIITALQAEVLGSEPNREQEVHTACGSDMMSDVLAYVKDQAVLLTGLTNPQVVRTASMMDMVCIVFVRGKRPDAAILQLADTMGITVLGTRFTMFQACGLLYQSGLRGGKQEQE